MATPTPGRGPSPEDATLFAPAALALLRTAQEEAAWLLGRGYPMPTVIRTVGDHHQLHARQRLAVQRSTCSPAARTARADRVVPAEALRRRHLEIDGFNLLVTLEVALAGGVVLAGADGALRDLAGLKGNYHLVPETDAALALVEDAVRELGPASLTFWLDAPISNSGRLRARILERAAAWPCTVTAELVPDADPVLGGKENVVSSDSAVLDACASWVRLSSWIIEKSIPSAWIVPLA